MLVQDKYVVVKGIAGLGNRLLCVLTAILYARLTRRRLLVDWRDRAYSDNGANAFHQYFLCKLCDPRDEIPATDSVRPVIWRGHLRDSAASIEKQHAEASGIPEMWRKFSVDLSQTNYAEDVLVMWSYYAQIDELRQHFRGEFKSLRRASTTAILRDLMQEYLVLHPAIQQRVDCFRAERFNGKTVGVHVRYTDKKTRLAEIQQRLEALLQREPELQIFLATDSLKVHNLFVSRYARVVSTTKWYPTSGISMHQNPKCPDRNEEGASALVDLYLLASCDYLIVDESSSFSYLATLLTNAQAARVINVQKYRAVPPRVRHMVWRFKVKLRWRFRRAKKKL